MIKLESVEDNFEKVKEKWEKRCSFEGLYLGSREEGGALEQTLGNVRPTSESKNSL